MTDALEQTIVSLLADPVEGFAIRARLEAFLEREHATLRVRQRERARRDLATMTDATARNAKIKALDHSERAAVFREMEHHEAIDVMLAADPEDVDTWLADVRSPNTRDAIVVSLASLPVYCRVPPLESTMIEITDRQARDLESRGLRAFVGNHRGVYVYCRPHHSTAPTVRVGALGASESWPVMERALFDVLCEFDRELASLADRVVDLTDEQTIRYVCGLLASEPPNGALRARINAYPRKVRKSTAKQPKVTS